MTLIEVLVALTVFGIASTGLAAMTFWIGTRGAVAAASSTKAAALVAESDRLAAIPFDSLALRAGCESRGGAPFAYERCVIVTPVSDGRMLVALVLSPRQRGVVADTLLFERVRGIPYNPLQ